MFDELMLPDEADLNTGPDGASLVSMRVRLPWYRSLPISCIEKLDVTVDGEPVPRESITISVGDVHHTLDEAATKPYTSWFVLDRAVTNFRLQRELSPGLHEVGLSLGLRIPYADPDFADINFTQTAQHSRSVDFLGGDR